MTDTTLKQRIDYYNKQVDDYEQKNTNIIPHRPLSVTYDEETTFVHIYKMTDLLTFKTKFADGRIMRTFRLSRFGEYFINNYVD